MFGGKKNQPWKRKKENYTQRRQKARKYRKREWARRRNQMYSAYPLSRQLDMPIGLSLGISTPIYGHHLQNGPVMMKNAVRRSGNVFSRAKSAFNGLARSWRNTVDGTANILSDAWKKMLRRVSHGYRKMGKERSQEYKVGYNYPRKSEVPLIHHSMDYAINFTPIKNPYSSEYEVDDDSNLVTSTKHDYDLYGNYVREKDYLDHVMVDESIETDTIANTHANIEK